MNPDLETTLVEPSHRSEQKLVGGSDIDCPDCPSGGALIQKGILLSVGSLSLVNRRSFSINKVYGKESRTGRFGAACLPGSTDCRGLGLADAGRVCSQADRLLGTMRDHSPEPDCAGPKQVGYRTQLAPRRLARRNDRHCRRLDSVSFFECARRRSGIPQSSQRCSGMVTHAPPTAGC